MAKLQTHRKIAQSAFIMDFEAISGLITVPTVPALIR